MENMELKEGIDNITLHYGTKKIEILRDDDANFLAVKNTEDSEEELKLSKEFFESMYWCAKIFNFMGIDGLSNSEQEELILKLKELFSEKRNEILDLPLIKTSTDKELLEPTIDLKLGDIDDLLIESQWDSWFYQCSWNNTLYGRALFHVNVGVVLREYNRGIKIGNQEKDDRTHIIIIQPRRSGKEEGMKGTERVSIRANRYMKEKGLNFLFTPVRRSKITSNAALTGTYRPPLSKNEKKQGEMVWEPGDLENHNIVTIGESSGFMASNKINPENLEIQNILLQAMDKGGQITKKKADCREHQFNTLTGFVFASRETKEMRKPEILLSSGFIHRTIPIIRQLDIPTIRQNAKQIIEKIQNEENTDFFGEDFLAQWFANFAEFASKHDINTFDKEAIDILKSCQEEMFSVIEDMHITFRSEAEALVSAYTQHLITLAHHYAYLRMDENRLSVIREDVQRAFKLLRQSLDLLLIWLERNEILSNEASKYGNRIRDLTKLIIESYHKANPGNEWIYSAKFGGILVKELKKSQSTIYSYLANPEIASLFEFNEEKPGSAKRKMRLMEEFL